MYRDEISPFSARRTKHEVGIVIRRNLDSWLFTLLVAILMVVLVVNNFDEFEKMIALLFTWEP